MPRLQRKLCCGSTEGSEKSDPFSDGYSSDQFLLPSGKRRGVREHICRGAYKHAKRPILINNWEATYFDFNEEKILKIAEQAQKLGIEMLVLDDGWFGKREDDNSGLGDWFVSLQKKSIGWA